MRNGFGLKLLHKFFNLPFLQLQKETLLKQLERNEFEIKATIQELDIYGESDEANYNKFIDNLTKRRREIADSNSNIPPQMQIPLSASAQHLNTSQITTDMKRSQSASIIIGAGKPIPFNPANGSLLKKPATSTNNTKSSKSSSQSSGFISKFGVKDKLDIVDGEYPDIKKLEISPITSVEEFCPDGGQIDRSFLDDVHLSPQINHVELEESDR